MTLLRALMRHSVASLNAAAAKEVASSLTVIANEKLKAEKDSTAGKKKTELYVPTKRSRRETSGEVRNRKAREKYAARTEVERNEHRAARALRRASDNARERERRSYLSDERRAIIRQVYPEAAWRRRAWRGSKPQ